LKNVFAPVPAPSAEVTAVVIEEADPRVERIQDPDPSAVVQLHVEGFLDAREGGLSACGLFTEGWGLSGVGGRSGGRRGGRARLVGGGRVFGALLSARRLQNGQAGDDQGYQRNGRQEPARLLHFGRCRIAHVSYPPRVIGVRFELGSYRIPDSAGIPAPQFQNRT
jgi:hypothetical protein